MTPINQAVEWNVIRVAHLSAWIYDTFHLTQMEVHWFDFTQRRSPSSCFWVGLAMSQQYDGWTKAFQRKNYQENIEKDAASLAASWRWMRTPAVR